MEMLLRRTIQPLCSESCPRWESGTGGLLTSGSSSPCAFPRHSVVAFQVLPGVAGVVPGYSGGTAVESHHTSDPEPVRINPVAALNTVPILVVQEASVEFRPASKETGVWPLHPEIEHPTIKSP